jgi:hypothetical protein
MPRRFRDLVTLADPQRVVVVSAAAPSAPITDDLWLDTASSTGTTYEPTVTARTQTGNYSLALGDGGTVVEMNVASANTLTVPPNSSAAFPVGTIVEVFQLGAGQTTITPGAGVTFRSDGGKTKLAAQYASASLRKRATDEWVLAGDLST